MASLGADAGTDQFDRDARLEQPAVFFIAPVVMLVHERQHHPASRKAPATDVENEVGRPKTLPAKELQLPLATLAPLAANSEPMPAEIEFFVSEIERRLNRS